MPVSLNETVKNLIEKAQFLEHKAQNNKINIKNIPEYSASHKSLRIYALELQDYIKETKQKIERHLRLLQAINEKTAQILLLLERFPQYPNVVHLLELEAIEAMTTEALETYRNDLKGDYDMLFKKNARTRASALDFTESEHFDSEILSTFPNPPTNTPRIPRKPNRKTK